ncbi:MAG: DUF4037 domain-containing protein [Chloroflexia bacterium]
MTPPTFIPGLELGRLYYTEAIRPILDASYPDLPHDAALIGSGSDKLGFDTPMSRDHDWGPSCILFVRESDLHIKLEIEHTLSLQLPRTLHGYTTHFDESPLEAGTMVMTDPVEGPIKHRVTVTTVRAFVQQHLGYDLNIPIQPADWLTFPSQRLRTLTAGAIYHEGIGHVRALREKFAWYPHDVWLYLLASGWTRIAQEEHLMPRAGYVDDPLGSALIGSRLVRDIITLCFLMEKQYAPYPKWFGTAFKQLHSYPILQPILWRAQIAQNWQERESALVEAYAYIAQAHNALGITDPLPEEPTQFFNRPFKVIWGERFADAIAARITDPEVIRIASRRMIGSIDQFSDSTDLREDSTRRAELRNLY